MGCPLQFRSSIRLVSSCSCLSQIYSDIHSRSCWTLELSATHLLLLMWIGCTGQSWGRVEGTEAISNRPATRMKPFNLKQLCGGSWKECFLEWASFLLLSFGRKDWRVRVSWDVLGWGAFLLVFCLFSFSFQQWQDIWYTARVEVCEMI